MGKLLGQSSSQLDLSIIVVSHGHERFLPGCIGSIPTAAEGLTYEIILIDNLGGGSRDALPNALDLPVRHFENDSPQGFATNVNLGAEHAQGRYLLILNPDTTYASGQIREMIQFLEGATDAGVLGCRLVYPDNTLQPSYRRFPTVPTLLGRGLNFDNWSRRPEFYRYRMMEDEYLDQTTSVDWVFGAFMLVESSRFRSLGGMDAKFRLYYEDVDLCYRYRLKGLRTYYFPSVVFVHHHLRTSAAKPGSDTWRWHVASSWRYFRKHGYAFRPRVELPAK